MRHLKRCPDEHLHVEPGGCFDDTNHDPPLPARGKHRAPEVVGDGCECWITDEKYWFYYGSAVEPGSQVEWNPDCPKHPGSTQGLQFPKDGILL